MYQIRCDDYILYDPREESLSVLEPRCLLKANSVGEGSFVILPNHEHYDKLIKLKSIFEIWEGDDVIFRGRMINGILDMNKQLSVDLEGILGVTNDTIIPPFKFPEDFKEAASADNVVEFFLQWILDCHNELVSDWQKLKLGRVTVADPNNYITRSSESYASTWETLKNKLFESSLGGYLCIRYETDGNYVDYLDSFPRTNAQSITLGENLLDITNQMDATATYSAILPVGADGLTIKDLPDGELSDDYVKQGVYIYSKSAVAAYGWICTPIEESTWDDVTEAKNLQTKAKNALSTNGITFANTITVKAVDLHFTDSEIQSIRICQNVRVNSKPHGIENVIYPLTELDIDITNPQNTVITIGDTRQTLIDKQHTASSNAAIKIEDIHKNIIDITDKMNNIDGLFFYIRYSEYSDGRNMTEEPNENTIYMGTCSTNLDTAPEDPAKYTWCQIVGADGASGADGRGIAFIVEEYYHSDSATELEGGEWTEVVPSRDESKYLWTRTVITYTDESILETAPICVTGNRGATGDKGADAILLQILSSNGHLFKNSDVSTTLTVEILTGGVNINSSEDMLTYFGADAKIIWQEKKQGETEYTDLPADDPRISDNGFIFTLNAEDLQMETVYMCCLDY